MKKITLSIIALLLINNSFAQKVDFINAPLNPMPSNGNVAQNNLKGDVFQLNFRNFTRDGKWISYKNSNEKVFLDASGKVTEEVNSMGNIHFYEYNSKGLIAKFTRGSHGESTIYTYDQKNRIIKEVYKHPNESWIKDYTYIQNKEMLIIIEKQSGGDRPYEVERHFKNGLEIQFQYKGKDARKYHYEFDKKGNWIKRLTHDMMSKTLIYKVDTRDIIYYDEYDQGINGMSVVAEKIIDELDVLSPILRIYNKKYHTAFSRFNNDYVFYDGLSKTYYVARDAYIKNKTIGQKTMVEKLLGGYGTVLLSDGKIAAILEAGKAEKSFSDWKPTSFIGFIIATDSVAKKSFAFEPIPAISDGKIVALGGKDMLDGLYKVSYLLNREKKALFIFENGKSITVTSAAILEGDKSIVIIVNGMPKFVTPPDKSRADNVISPARYFDPVKDKILTKKATPAATPQTNTSASTSVLPPANNSTSLSTDSRNYLAVYKNNPEGVKEHLAALYNVMLQKKYPPTMISGLFAIVAKEVFTINEDAAFDLLMKMPNGVIVRDVLSSLPKEMREVIGKRARAKVATYANE